MKTLIKQLISAILVIISTTAIACDEGDTEQPVDFTGYEHEVDDE